MPTEPDRSHQKPPFLKRVRIRNYKSIKFCDVELEPLTVLVGRNGSGKSNFVDALGFLRDVVTWDLRKAVEKHGGSERLVFRSAHSGSSVERIGGSAAILPQTSSARMVSFEITADVGFPGEETVFRFEIDFSTSPYRIVHESAQRRDSHSPPVGYTAAETHNGSVLTWTPGDPKLPSDVMHSKLRPALSALLLDGFGGLYERLDLLRTYNFNPESIRRLQTLNGESFLDADGANLPSALRAMTVADPWLVARASGYLRAITGNIDFDNVLPLEEFETLRFHVHAKDRPLGFTAASMSDGTLRAFAALVSAFQQAGEDVPSLVAIEEPETSLHPAATAALVDALDEATGRTQILITTHSAELLDNPTIGPENVRVVEMVDGETFITRVNAASVKNIAEGLNTLGGLERENRLKLNRDDLRELRIAGERAAG